MTIRPTVQSGVLCGSRSKNGTIFSLYFFSLILPLYFIHRYFWSIMEHSQCVVFEIYVICHLDLWLYQRRLSMQGEYVESRITKIFIVFLEIKITLYKPESEFSPRTRAKSTNLFSKPWMVLCSQRPLHLVVSWRFLGYQKEKNEVAHPLVCDVKCCRRIENGDFIKQILGKVNFFQS